MNDADLALYQQAQALANSGQMFAAYEMFRSLRERNPDVEILFGIATTTPNLVEARQVIDSIKSLQPGHPLIPRMEALHNRKMETTYTPYVPMAPVLLCPYCGTRAPVVIMSKTSTGGWIILVVLLLTTIIFFWVGLLFQEKYYVCSHCGSKIASQR